MEMYKVVVRNGDVLLDGKKLIPVYEAFTGIYAKTAEEAIESVVVQHKVDPSKIHSVETERQY